MAHVRLDRMLDGMVDGVVDGMVCAADYFAFGLSFCASVGAPCMPCALSDPS